MTIPAGIKTLTIDTKLLEIVRVAVNNYIGISKAEREGIEITIANAK